MIDRFFGENFDIYALKYEKRCLYINKKKSAFGGLSLYSKIYFILCAIPLIILSLRDLRKDIIFMHLPAGKREKVKGKNA